MCEVGYSVSIPGCEVGGHLWKKCLLVLASNYLTNYLREHRKWPVDLSCLAYLVRRLSIPGWEEALMHTNENDTFVSLDKSSHEIQRKSFLETAWRTRYFQYVASWKTTSEDFIHSEVAAFQKVWARQ